MRRRGVVIGLIAIAVIVYVLVVLLYASSGRQLSLNTGADAEPDPDAVTIVMTPQSVNGAAERITMDVEITPPLDLMSDDSPTLIAPLSVIISPVDGEQSIELAEGAIPSTKTVAIKAPGAIENWPFDRYEQDSLIVVAYTIEDGVKVPLDARVDMEGYVSGWSFDAKIRTSSDYTFEGADGVEHPLDVIDLSAGRSGSTMAFGFLLLALLVVMPTLVLIVSISVFTGRRKVEATLMSWIGAMLFATIPLRTFLPGSPPIGSWIDFLIVLWVIAALIAGLVIYIAAWNRWGSPDPRREP
jgi:hypothetical protein